MREAIGNSSECTSNKLTTVMPSATPQICTHTYEQMLRGISQLKAKSRATAKANQASVKGRSSSLRW